MVQFEPRTGVMEGWDGGVADWAEMADLPRNTGMTRKAAGRAQRVAPRMGERISEGRFQRLKVGESVLNAGGKPGDCVLNAGGMRGKAWGKHGESVGKAWGKRREPGELACAWFVLRWGFRQRHGGSVGLQPRIDSAGRSSNQSPAAAAPGRGEGAGGKESGARFLGRTFLVVPKRPAP